MYQSSTSSLAFLLVTKYYMDMSTATMTKVKRGVKTILTDDMITKLREQVIEGRTVQEVSKNLGIPATTIYTWKSDNYLDINSKWSTWELEAKLLQAEKFSKNLLNLTAKGISADGREYNDSRLLAVQQREAEYLRTTLLIAKSKYDSKQSQTVNIILPTPIMDIQTVVHDQSVEKEKVTGEGLPD